MTKLLKGPGMAWPEDEKSTRNCFNSKVVGVGRSRNGNVAAQSECSKGHALLYSTGAPIAPHGIVAAKRLFECCKNCADFEAAG
jgi:hypothetical protein